MTTEKSPDNCFEQSVIMRLDWICPPKIFERWREPCEVRSRSKTEGGHISPYSVYNLFIIYFTIEFTICKLSYCNLKYLKCSSLSKTLVNSFEKDRADFCWIKTTSKHCEKKLTIFWHQKTIKSDRQCCPWALSSSCSDLLAPLSTFIFTWHDAMLLTWGFCRSKSFESSCEKPL